MFCCPIKNLSILIFQHSPDIMQNIDLFCLSISGNSVIRLLPEFPILFQDVVVSRWVSWFNYLIFGYPKSKSGLLQGHSLTHPTIFTTLFLFQQKGHREPWGCIPIPLQAYQGSSNQEPYDSEHNAPSNCALLLKRVRSPYFH